MIIGDLNSYAKEDPISAIENAGYLNLTETAEGAGGYSYTFDGEFGHLDHALGSASLSSQVTGAATWHVNSDEPIYYDYNLENKDATQQAINVGTPYRYSDHDPVVIGLNLVSVPAITVQPVSATATVGTSVTLAVTASGTPVPTYQWRKNGVAIPGATGASFTIATPVVADSGLYDVVVTNALGFATSASITLTINPATASVTLGDLEQLYDGTPRTVTATTNPASLDVNFTYDGSASAPIYPGAYEVVGTIADPDYVGSAADTLVVTSTGLVRHAPALSGAIIGSLQVALPESFALNGSALISGDLLVPGTPTVVVNSGATYGGTLNATGSVSPSNYSVTLNKSTVLRHVVRRVAPPALPVVSNPPLPTGTRNVTLNAVGQSAGSFATLLNLTLNSKAGQVAVPPGTYGSFTANKNTGFVLGVAGAVSPTVYNLQALTLNGGSQLTVIGPVILTLAHGSSLAGTLGASAHPEWLELRIAAGDVSFTADAHAAVIAPTSAVTINATLTGSMVSDRLIINRTGLLQDPP
ncbi:MAG: MBG domain-containing protein [Opitutus sp.]